MKSFDTEIKKYTNKVRLKASERDALRERILTYMEYHPLPKQSVHEAVETIASESFVSVHFNALYMRIAGAMAVVMLVVVPFAAERAVPGDVLYPIKTQVNEGIRQQLANSPYERVVLETQLLERRIAEARLLASEGKLTDEVEATLAETVKGHADAAQEGIAELRVADADEAAIAEIAYGSALEVQTAVLDVEAGTATTSPFELAVVVREAQADALAAKGTSTPSYKSVMARVELETTRAHELLATIDASLTEEERVDIERRLADIGRTIGAAQEADVPEVETTEDMRVTDLISALGLTQKLIAFMTDIDVSQTVALETLVPMELTEEERVQRIEGELIAIAEVRATVESRFSNMTLELQEKVTFGLAALDGHVASTTAALAADTIEAAEMALTEATAIAEDLTALTSEILVSEETPEAEVEEEGEGETEEAEEAPEEEEVEVEEGVDPEEVVEEPAPTEPETAEVEEGEENEGSEEGEVEATTPEEEVVEAEETTPTETTEEAAVIDESANL